MTAHEKPTADEVRQFVELAYWLAGEDSLLGDSDDMLEMASHPPDDDEYWYGPYSYSTQVEACKQRHPSRGKRDGFMLVEVLCALVIIGLLVVPLSTLLVTTMRASVSAQQSAQQAAALASAVFVSPHVAADPCSDLDSYVEQLTALLHLETDWTLEASVSSCAPTLVVVSIGAPGGSKRSVTSTWSAP